jgi:hypothetical protein
VTYTHKLRELVAFVILKQKGNEFRPQIGKNLSLLPIAITLKVLELEFTLISNRHAITI